MCYNTVMSSVAEQRRVIRELREKLKHVGSGVVPLCSEAERVERNRKSRERLRSRYVGTVVNGKRVRLPAPNKRPWPGYCELCGSTRRLDYHHWDKSNPSKGLWLCYRCHMLAEAADRGVTTGNYLQLKAGVEDDFRLGVSNPTCPSLVDIVMDWGLKKEV